VYRQINSKQDTEILQNDLLCLEHWANKWFMEFNLIKCVVLTITHQVNPMRTSCSLYGQELNQVHQAKYLGHTLER